MPWEDDEPAFPVAAPAAAPKMPWEDDEPAAGPAAGLADDDFPVRAPAQSGTPFEGEPEAPAQPASGRFDTVAYDEPAAAPRGPAQDDDFLNSLGSAAQPRPEPANPRKKWLLLGMVLAILALLGGGLFYFKPWTKMNIPFLSGGAAKKEGADSADKVKDIALRNVRQYYIPNEKAGNIFVVEGKAVNNFATPKERIKVEITLFDEKGHPLASKQLLCGNTLSQFQLQVQSEEEIAASLNSEVGILTSNTYLKTGMDTPFMAVFFKPPDTVKEFGVKVIDALDPK